VIFLLNLVRIGVICWAGIRGRRRRITPINPGLSACRYTIAETVHLCLRHRGDGSRFREMEGEDGLRGDESLTAS
jgi:hypothetical protein